MKLENLYLKKEYDSLFGVIDSFSQAQLAFMSSRIENGPILEIGSWLGKSSYIIADNKKSNVVLHCVDPFMSSFEGEKPLYPQADIVKYYLNHNSKDAHDLAVKLKELIYEHRSNVEAVKFVLSKFLDTVVLHQTLSQHFTLDFAPEFAFIDGGHTYEECFSDLNKVIVHNNCLIAVHDYDQIEVAKAVTDTVQMHNKDLYVVGTMAWIIEKGNSKKSLIDELVSLTHE